MVPPRGDKLSQAHASQPLLRRVRRGARPARRRLNRIVTARDPGHWVDDQLADIDPKRAGMFESLVKALWKRSSMS